jgi:threonine synthase
MRTTIICHGCGYVAPPLEPRPFRCPHAGDDVDHVLMRRLDGASAEPFFDRKRNPFVRFRSFTHAWHTAMAIGMSDRDFVALAGDEFVETPLYERDGIVIKDETNNVAGSHKARHLMGLRLWLEVAQRIDPSLSEARLAIASCGNAALAAATVAKRPLDVFVPDDAALDELLIELLALGANVTRCARRAGEHGDPAYLRFREAVAAGALPFTCQGNENGLTIEGGQTLGWELASQLTEPLDRLFLQVGGGALASAVIAGLEEAHALGVLQRMPRIHAVQTAAASPLVRAWARVEERGLDFAIRHRSQVMWPWETPPHSMATGILDDETYDWAAVVRGMQRTGGWPVVVSEDELREATDVAGGRVSATGAAGLAGLLAMRKRGEIATSERCGVIFTGVARGSR